MKAILVSVVLSIVTSFAAASVRCGAGGEGPKPFNDITKNLDFKIRAIDTPGTIDQFLIWEKKQALVYRDTAGEIKGLYLRPQVGKPKEFPINKIAQPLSRVVDAQERFLTSLGDRIWTLDTFGSIWMAAVEKKDVQPLFWANRNGQDVLISQAHRTNESGEEVYEFYASKSGEFQKYPHCSFVQPKPYPFTPARGAMAPNVYFYSTEMIDGRRFLNIHSFNTLNCKFEKGLVFEGVRYPVKEVMWFQNLSAFAAKLDHAEENLLWWSPKGCNYFNVGRNETFVPNFQQPVMVTWSQTQTLNVIYPDTAQVVRTLENLPITSLNENDLWLTADAKKLYMRTMLEAESNRWLLEMDLSKPKPAP